MVHDAVRKWTVLMTVQRFVVKLERNKDRLLSPEDFHRVILTYQKQPPSHFLTTTTVSPKKMFLVVRSQGPP